MVSLRAFWEGKESYFATYLDGKVSDFNHDHKDMRWRCIKKLGNFSFGNLQAGR